LLLLQIFPFIEDKNENGVKIDTGLLLKYFRCFEFFDKTHEMKQERIAEFKLLKNELNNLVKIIDSNKTLKLEFNKLYEENKYLLDNPNELFMRFEQVASEFDSKCVNELEGLNVKKLIK